MDYKDLRDWLQIVSDFGELKVVKGADWNMEIGPIQEVNHKEYFRRGMTVPALMFDEIKGYAAGFRVLTNSLSSVARLGLSLNLDLMKAQGQLGLIDASRKLLSSVVPIPPRVVKKGPVMENIDEGNKVDLTKFPVPLWHEQDGGRYIGTGSLTITRDPDEGWVNLGTYRVMLHDENTVGFFVSPGKHGYIHREKFFSEGKPCPVSVVVGSDPLLMAISGKEIDYGVGEYDFSGGIKGSPIDLIEGSNGLPFPATAEIVLEGESIPGELKKEGPFGEWTGYYGSSTREEPFIRVKRVLYRNDPIILGAPPCKPPNMNSFVSCILRSGLIWNELERNSVPDIRGVACHDAGGHRLYVVVAIKQRYSGHARQAAFAASQCHSAAYLGRYIIVVDDDIDPTDLHDVTWAMCTRCDPEYDIDIIRRCWSGPLDPIIPLERRGFSSRAIIDACKPWERLKSFPKTAEVSPEMRASVLKKWSHLFPSDETGKPKP